MSLALVPLNSGYLVAFLLLAGTMASAQTPEPGTPPLSVCEALAKRTDFQRRMIKVRGEVRSGGHGAYLVPSAICSDKVVTRGVEWPNVIFLTYPNNASPSETDHASFRIDWRTIRKTQNAIRRAPFNPDTDRIIETYTGLFETYLDLEKRVSPGVPGALRLGFGPVGLGAPAQLLIQAATDAAVVHPPGQ